MNPRGTLLAIAAAVLFVPTAVQAAPPVVIGDGSVCLDIGKGGPAFPEKGNTHSYKVSIVRIVVDSAAAGSACAPRISCKGAQGCSEHEPDQSVVVFFTESETPPAATITVTSNPSASSLSFALDGADWSQFGDDGGSGRQKVIDKAAKIDKVTVGGQTVSCRPCRVTFVAK